MTVSDCKWNQSQHESICKNSNRVSRQCTRSLRETLPYHYLGSESCKMSERSVCKVNTAWQLKRGNNASCSGTSTTTNWWRTVQRNVRRLASFWVLCHRSQTVYHHQYRRTSTKSRSALTVKNLSRKTRWSHRLPAKKLRTCSLAAK